MKPVNDLKEIDIDSVTIALTGDGSWERVVLKAMAERHDGSERALLIPIAVAVLGRGNRKTGRFSGLSALQSIKTYVGQSRIRRYLFLIDIEHVNDKEEIKPDLEASARQYGFDLQRPIEVIGNQAFLIRCRVGSHEITVHTVVSGRKKCIEESISALISLEWGIDVESSKCAIRKILKQKDADLFSLVRTASSYNVGQALPGLTAAFESMESTY
jgi:hypothetical protein